MIWLFLYFTGLFFFVMVIELFSRPAKHNPNVKGLSMYHHEGIDR